MAKRYDENGENQKAARIAAELLNKDVKVESRAIEEMRDELKRLLQK
ncbi:MAG: hypothetical protein JEZ14_14185 [Marinilabiliaceae bacterium]|nr:hypothetical protein [Marinilabiliaceae bacterium]MBI9063127.1 hypothetical protein [Marinilabiliaceae bacterium]